MSSCMRWIHAQQFGEWGYARPSLRMRFCAECAHLSRYKGKVQSSPPVYSSAATL
eukprot:IDg12203t1